MISFVNCLSCDLMMLFMSSYKRMYIGWGFGVFINNLNIYLGRCSILWLLPWPLSYTGGLDMEHTDFAVNVLFGLSFFFLGDYYLFPLCYTSLILSISFVSLGLVYLLFVAYYKTFFLRLYLLIYIFFYCICFYSCYFRFFSFNLSMYSYINTFLYQVFLFIVYFVLTLYLLLISGLHFFICNI